MVPPSDTDFSGLSGNGDSVFLWDSNPSSGGTLVDSVTFGAATEGASFAWDLEGNSLGVSSAGSNGAFLAPNDSDGGVGLDTASPRVVVPEPSSAFLGLLGLLLCARRRR